jgi:hypothetical protein
MNDAEAEEGGFMQEPNRTDDLRTHCSTRCQGDGSEWRRR